MSRQAALQLAVSDEPLRTCFGRPLEPSLASLIDVGGNNGKSRTKRYQVNVGCRRPSLWWKTTSAFMMNL